MVRLRKETSPVVFLKDIVLFPDAITILLIQRPRSINAIDIVLSAKKEDHIICAAQKDPDVDDITLDDVYHTGVRAKILQLVKLTGNTIKMLVMPEKRVALSNICLNTEADSAYYQASYSIIEDRIDIDFNYLNDLLNNLIQRFSEYIKSTKKLNPEILNSLVIDQRNPGSIPNIIASHLSCSLEEKQNILEIADIQDRISYLEDTILAEVTSIETERAIQARVKEQQEQVQRTYQLHEQMKAIQKELGEYDEKGDLAELDKKIAQTKLSPEAKEKALSELRKLKMMGPATGEAGIIRNYLDTLLALPWKKYSKEKIDIDKVIEILDYDHYGLDKVKDRITEYIAVLQRKQQNKDKNIQGAILCFVGPPGIGKTSLAQSIARAIGREFAKCALGGVRDEAEIRGHRRTYLGSMPGKPIQLLRKAKSDNPVILLDEIDKLGSDLRGDPTSALLELLDPEQNSHFLDHYLDVEYDMSKVLFIATANSLNMPRPLIDRLEIINISGYIEEEKLQIAKNYLVPKELKNQGLKPEELQIPDETLLHLIRYYTRESGVRGLKRIIGSLARKVLKNILRHQVISPLLTCEKVEELIGPRKYKIGLIEEQDLVGVTTGLAYTELGGDLLMIEAITTPGKGELKVTGALGDVMKESMQAAFSFFCAKAQALGISAQQYKAKDIHIHVPEGAIPKDGPSAGIAIFTTIASAMTNIPVKHTVAMTGEITLRGRVLAIGGLREKLLAAYRGGIETVIIPIDCKADLTEIPDYIKNKLNIITVSEAEEVLNIALAASPYRHELAAYAEPEQPALS